MIPIFLICAVMWIVGYFTYPLVALLGIAGLLLWIVATEYNNGIEGEKKIIIAVAMVIHGAIMLVMYAMDLSRLFFTLSWILAGWVVKKIEERYTLAP